MAKKPGRTEQAHWASRYGTDADFLEFVRRQPSVLSGRFSEWVNGEGRCVAAHVRRVGAGAGTGLKPPFSAVPLTQSEHLLQHQHGEEYFHPLDWWEKQAERIVERWIDLESALTSGAERISLGA